MLAATAQTAEPPRTSDAMVPDDTGPCELTLVTSRADFDALEGAWNDLFSRAGRGTQIFQTFNWNWHWCNHYLEPAPGETDAASLAIVTGRRGGRLVMVWPLVIERVLGLRRLRFMGAPVSQYGDVLIEDAADAADLLREAWRFIEAEVAPDVALFRKVRDDAAIAPLLTELDARTIERLEAPYLDIASASDFSGYEQRYSPRSRRNRRRLGRRLAEQGVMTFERFTEGARARELATVAIAMKRVWLKDRGLYSAAFSDPRMDGFFAAVAEGAERPTGCQVSALISNGEATSIEINFRAKDRVVMHVIVFNLKFEKAGAGVLLLENTISQAFGGDYRTFDLLAPADGYKLDWADATMGVSDQVVPLSSKGWVYARVYLDLVRQSIKAVLAALPVRLRRAIVSS